MSMLHVSKLTVNLNADLKHPRLSYSPTLQPLMKIVPSPFILHHRVQSATGGSLQSASSAPEYHKGGPVLLVQIFSHTLARTVRRASFLSDSGCHGGAHGPSCRGRQLFDFCVKPPDYPLHGFTTLVKKERVSPLERWEEKTPTSPSVVDSSKDFRTKLSYIVFILNVAS